MGAGAVAAVGECMLELSGRPDGGWNLGYAGDTFNTLWAIRALTDGDCDYVSAFGDDPFSQKQVDFFRDNGIGVAASPFIEGARPESGWRALSPRNRPRRGSRSFSPARPDPTPVAARRRRRANR